MNNLKQLFVESWARKEGEITSTKAILDWVKELNRTTKVEIHKVALADSDFWFYDELKGCVKNKNDSFFEIQGLKVFQDDQCIAQQPVIVQGEIGYLGIICQVFQGVLYFLMQAKIEPGNVNKIQLSPTIQATKSNFTQKHGGKKPAYLDYFINASQHTIVVDQIQSEQSSRFYKKRNRNIIIVVDEDIEVLPNFRWMTLGQIKNLMRIENLVNMDTRTVLSCIPFSLWHFEKSQLEILSDKFNDQGLFKSIFVSDGTNQLPQIYQAINNYKMFHEVEQKFVALHDLEQWEMGAKEYISKTPYPFKVIFCNIAIEGREVKRWTQPLFEAVGVAVFGLLMGDMNGIKKFLVKLTPEIGCFDKVELGPTIQKEGIADKGDLNQVEQLFYAKLEQSQGVLFDNLLSEEGGRFYHEQNRNIIIEIDPKMLEQLPEGYFWLDYKTLNLLVQVNNCLNIQLRNLLSLLEV